MKFQFPKIKSDAHEEILRFLGVFFAVMLVSYGFLYAIDFYPEPEGEETIPVEESATSTDSMAREDTAALVPAGATAELPDTIHIDALNKSIPVLNPTSPTIAALDNALLDGVVRHPESAHFGDVGNIFILGHSSYLPNVFNKNYQAFNGIQELTWGDTIRLESADAEYTYRVERVYRAKAHELVVPTNWGSPRLTLATCNTLGAKEDRFIVEAALVRTRIL